MALLPALAWSTRNPWAWGLWELLVPVGHSVLTKPRHELPKGQRRGESHRSWAAELCGQQLGALGGPCGPRALFAELKRLRLEREGILLQPGGGAAPGMAEKGAAGLRRSVSRSGCRSQDGGARTRGRDVIRERTSVLTDELHLGSAHISSYGPHTAVGSLTRGSWDRGN